MIMVDAAHKIVTNMRNIKAPHQEDWKETKLTKGKYMNLNSFKMESCPILYSKGFNHQQVEQLFISHA